METCLTQSCTAASTGSPMLFAQLIRTLLAAQCGLSQPTDYPPDRTAEMLANPDEEFDFVVVGAGTAGSVVASRLSENEKWKVLLIEAGDYPSTWSDVPAVALTLQGTTEDYAYAVEPQDDVCLGMKNKRCTWAKGKALGGTSVINAMLQVRGHKRDYDEWARLGNPGWSFEEVLPYFKKSENYPPEFLAKHGSKYFGTGGPVTLRSYNYSDSEMHRVIMDAVQERGVPILDVVNGEESIGFGKAYGTLDRGVRVSAAKAFLSPAKDRKNLRLILKARVDKIILEDKRATAVRVTLSGGETITVRATKEIVLSAGSIATPQLLMLSGIGPREHLQEFGIETIADLPVGQNLQDHLLWLGIMFKFMNETVVPPITPTHPLDEAYKYLIHRSGEFMSNGGFDLLGFLSLGVPHSNYPDTQFFHYYVSQGQAFKVQTVTAGFGINEEITDTISKLTAESDTILMAPTLLHPESTGEVKLRSNNPADPVKIYANYFADDGDVEFFKKALDFMKSLPSTETFEKLGIEMRLLPISTCPEAKLDSWEYWECNLRHTAGTLYHPVGTAKMGPSNDPTAVVDSTLKVHGIQGLRVIDASIMPNVPSGNTNSPTMMIAEKGSDMIKENWLINNEL